MHIPWTRTPSKRSYQSPASPAMLHAKPVCCSHEGQAFNAHNGFCFLASLRSKACDSITDIATTGWSSVWSMCTASRLHMDIHNDASRPLSIQYSRTSSSSSTLVRSFPPICGPAAMRHSAGSLACCCDNQQRERSAKTPQPRPPLPPPPPFPPPPPPSAAPPKQCPWGRNNCTQCNCRDGCDGSFW